ncbi:MAG TPA: MEDS domain-containing protein, partial [Sphingomonas sp.]|nr:MEDS domain-containing protein [Sphingomonas sp.]
MGDTTPSGIAAIGDLSRGSHFCQFYETEDDHVATIADYFRAGSKANELCLWLTSAPLTPGYAQAKLLHASPELEPALAEGAIEIVQADEWYLRGQQFRADIVVESWDRKLGWALAQGYAGLRVAANEAWLSHKLWHEFAEYECSLNAALAGKQMVVLCCYPLLSRTAEEVFEISDSHNFAIACRAGRWQVMESTETVGAGAELQRDNIELRQRIRQRTRQLERANGALVENEELFNSLAEHMSDVISLYDMNGRRVYVSPSHRRVLGWLPDDPFEGIHSSDREAVREAWDRLRAGESQTIRYRYWNAQGHWIWIEARCTPVLFRGSDHVLECQRDITKRVELEKQLHHSQKMEALGRLAGGVAHDINNVLTAIFGYAGLLRKQLADQEGPSACVHEIRTAAERARQLTRQLLTFARRDVSRPQVIDAAQVARKLERMLRLVVREDVEFIMETASERLAVHLDPLQLEQILLNLVVNARDATPAGGSIAVRCTLIDSVAAGRDAPALVVAGQYVLITVSDTGVGIPAELVCHVFEPFFTTKDAGKGTGLGLATVFGIVQQAKGYVWIDSEPGRGTTASVL